MMILLLLISSVIAATATINVEDLQKRAKLWRFGRKKTTQATSTTVRTAAVATRMPVIERPNVATPVSQRPAAVITQRPAERPPEGKDLRAEVPVFTPEGMRIAGRQRLPLGPKGGNLLPSCSKEFLKGKALNGKYKVEGMAGEGAFSVVFTAIHNGEKFAVKCLTKTNDPSTNDEITILKSLNHPNVIKMVDTFVEDGLLFIVTELCELDLEKFIEIHKKVDLQTAKIIIRQIASAVSYLHEVQISHRDLKPANILLKRFDEITVKVNDFGLSTTDILSEDRAGTPLYMAPESYRDLKGQPWAKTDVWAMALIFFNMLTGSNPWSEPAIPKQWTISRWKSKYGFSDKLITLFRKSFVVSEARPTADEFYQMILQL